MDKRFEPIPIDQTGNGSSLRTLQFEEADAYMLAKALSLAACEAMMDGGQSSIGRLKFYQKQLMELVPDGVSLFARQTDISEIVYLSQSTETWSCYRVKEHSWSNRFRAVFEIGGRKFKSKELLESDEPFDRMISAVKNLVSMKCERIETEDRLGSPWSI